jgi:hypothetical protein
MLSDAIFILMPSAILLSVIMLNAIMLNVIMLNVIMLNGIVLSVMAPRIKVCLNLQNRIPFFSKAPIIKLFTVVFNTALL